MTIPDARIQELIALCKKATPGPFTIRTDPTEMSLKALSYLYFYEGKECCSVWLARELNPEDSEKFAAFDPQTCLSILHELAQHRSDWAEAEAAYDHEFPDRPWAAGPPEQRAAMLIGVLMARLDRLRATLREAKDHIVEHNAEYKHTTSKEFLTEIDDLLSEKPA